jgi:cobalt/nickel transport system ATP-binding protein
VAPTASAWGTVGEIRQRVGVVFQNPDDQLFMPTIYDDVAFGLRNYGIAEADIEQRVNCQLRELRIARLKHRSSLRLSAGEKRTVAIATHDISFAAQVCDLALLLKSGRIFADGASAELLFDEKTMDECGVEAIPLLCRGGR